PLPYEARDVRELLDQLGRVPVESLFCHAAAALLHRPVLPAAYPNDFAVWAGGEMRDQRLAERLAAIDPFASDSMEHVREELVAVISDHLQHFPAPAPAGPTDPFRFFQAHLIPVAWAKLDDYRGVAPRGAVDFLLRIGERLRGRRLVHVSASRYGRVMVELLNRLVPILNDLGIDTSWEILIGSADFEGIMRTVSRGLMGTEQVVTDAMLARLRAVSSENAARLRLDGDLVMV